MPLIILVKLKVAWALKFHFNLWKLTVSLITWVIMMDDFWATTLMVWSLRYTGYDSYGFFYCYCYYYYYFYYYLCFLVCKFYGRLINLSIILFLLANILVFCMKLLKFMKVSFLFSFSISSVSPSNNKKESLSSIGQGTLTNTDFTVFFGHFSVFVNYELNIGKKYRDETTQ